MTLLAVAVEGASDVGAVNNIVAQCGGVVHRTFGRSGKPQILQNLDRYNAAAIHSPWFVLLDLDQDFDCAVEGRLAWLPSASGGMCFRIAVRELEAWLLADVEAVSDFLGVAQAKIPKNPESLADPKLAMINLARRSRRRSVREGLVPRAGSGTSIGPTYASDISDFGEHQWRPSVAAMNAPSLARCLDRLTDLIGSNRQLD